MSRAPASLTAASYVLLSACASTYEVEYKVTEEYVEVFLYDSAAGGEDDPHLANEDPDSVKFYIDVDGNRRCTAGYSEVQGCNYCRIEIPWETEPVPAIGEEGVRYVPGAYLLDIDAALYPEKSDCMMWGDTDLFGSDPGFVDIDRCHKIRPTLAE